MTIASRLVIDYRNATDVAVGEHGVSAADIDSVKDLVASEHERIVREHAEGIQRWQDLPDNTELADEIAAFAAEARETYTDFILIGIGGSSLG
ncbi:MAG TPA: hypothetical protein VNP95_05235, partial [Thermomicrobiales bacterium]|nr:hypothetical protein [Thermomicrobiales bacterium]